MEHEIDTLGALHRITVEDLEEEDQPEFVPTTKPAVYEPDHEDVVFVAFHNDCESDLYLTTSLKPGVIYAIEPED